MSSPDRYYTVTAPAGFEDYPARRNHYFKTKTAAAEFKLRVKRWKAEKKSPSPTLSFDEYDKRWLAYLKAHVGNLEILPEIVAHWERTAKAITQPLTVEALCKAFVTYRETKGYGKATLSEDRYIARKLQAALGPRMAHELTVADLRAFLNSAGGKQLERKLYKLASLIFDYAKEQRVIILNPLAEIDRPQVGYSIPGILSPAQFETLLSEAEAVTPDLVPFLALAGFAGIRREEMLKEYADDEVLQWSDIDWDKKIVTIRDEVAKQTTRKLGDRRFVPMEEALLHWLAPYRQASGPVMPVSDAAFRRRMKKLLEAAEFEPPRNALRHSYASYWLAGSSKEGIGRLALQMGNSESVCRRHYLETLSPEEGRAWFGLRRAKSQPTEAVPPVVIPVAA